MSQKFYTQDEVDNIRAYEYGEGFTDGKAEGVDEAYDAGYDLGHDDGHAEGYDEGYNAGVLAARAEVQAVPDAPDADVPDPYLGDYHDLTGEMAEDYDGEYEEEEDD